ncbi:MAG: hypothetical protein L3K03_04255, partial [Thermoplasmata archaeon]|nr:hypothetical protein [Thermoplasmata archaeon]
SVVAPTPTIRYVPTLVPPSGPTLIDANSSAQVVFSEEYLVTIVASQGGSPGTATQWANQSQRLDLSAVAASGYEFFGWNGTGLGSYSGSTASANVTVQGPIIEAAEFVPLASNTSVPPTPSTNGSSNLAGLPVALAALLALLVVGVLVGYLLLNRPPRQPPEDPEGSPTDEGGALSDDPEPSSGAELPPDSE